jgi:membrane protease YdiL (CAAX protease family)
VPLLDLILAFLLLIVLPARALWRSQTKPLETPRIRKYTVTILMVTSLVTILWIDWWIAGRSADALGLGLPTTTPALIGLGVSAGLLALFCILIWHKREAPAPEAERAARELLPQTASEIRMFVSFSLAVGFGWEVLYRGFLLFYLPLHINFVPAVIVSAIAYGAGHGFKNFGQFAGSIVAALAFAIGYALTANLWWLAILHVGLPLLTLAVRPNGRDSVKSEA